MMIKAITCCLFCQAEEPRLWELCRDLDSLRGEACGLLLDFHPSLPDFLPVTPRSRAEAVHTGSREPAGVWDGELSFQNTFLPVQGAPEMLGAVRHGAGGDFLGTG